jgi:hypothetical protein
VARRAHVKGDNGRRLQCESLVSPLPLPGRVAVSQLDLPVETLAENLRGVGQMRLASRTRDGEDLDEGSLDGNECA